MNRALLLPLVIAVTLSMVTTINVGIVCLASAWIVGVLLGIRQLPGR